MSIVTAASERPSTSACVVVMQQISQHICDDRRITSDESEMSTEGSPSLMA